MSWKVVVADYGENVYYGGFFDLESRLAALKSIGYDGLERLDARTEGAALSGAATFRRLGCVFCTVGALSPELSIKWSAAFGCTYVWPMVSGQDLDTFCRQVNHQAEACETYGIRVAVHNHMGQCVETHDQVLEYLRRCPKTGLILDTAHLAAVGGDPVAIAAEFTDRIAFVHFKDWIAEREADVWHKRGRFCELGAGNIGLDNAAVVEALRKGGYCGAVGVEQDTHLRDPLEDLKVSREYLRACGV